MKKQLLLTIIFFISAVSFSQDNSNIKGQLLDLEYNNAPLKFAKVSIKETGAEVLSDENGNFIFQNLKEGTYTLVCSFVGYENKELKAVVVSGESTPITLALGASTISIEDLMMALASADSNSNTIVSQ